jgi:hypothetical protein
MIRPTFSNVKTAPKTGGGGRLRPGAAGAAALESADDKHMMEERNLDTYNEQHAPDSNDSFSIKDEFRYSVLSLIHDEGLSISDAIDRTFDVFFSNTIVREAPPMVVKKF